MKSKLKKIGVSAVCLAVLLIAAGCRSNTNTAPQSESTRIVKDDLGNEVRLPAKVTRAVSLAPNLTEIVYAVGAGDRLVGVTTFCNYPAEAAKVKKIGDTLKPNIETIVALKPQVVLVTTASQLESFSKILKEQGIEVFVTNPSTLEGVYKGIGSIAEIFGEDKKAEELIASMKKRVADAAAEMSGAHSASVFVQIDKSLYTIGKTSFMSDAISKLGLKSVTDDISDAYPKISKERARTLNPDIIIISISPGNDAPNEVMNESAAVKEKRVYEIDADILSRPGPRIVKALEQIVMLERSWKEQRDDR